MTRHTRTIAAAAALLASLLSAQAAHAVVTTQTKNLSFSAGPVTDFSGAATLAPFGPNDLSATFDTFNSALGTLNSFSYTWNLNFQAAGTAANDGTTSTLTFNTVATLKVNSSVDEFAQSSNNVTASNGGPLSINFDIQKTRNFNVADAGVTYNPATLATVTGSTPFTLSYEDNFNPVRFSAANVTAQVTGSVSISYDYTAAAAVPEPGSWTLMLAGAGLLGALGLRRRQGRGAAVGR